MSKVDENTIFDVVAVNFTTSIVRLLAVNKSEENAESIIKFAVYRRGVDAEFYAEVPAGQYKEGDKWVGK